MDVVTAEEMRALDRDTIERLGIPAIALMENAGRAIAEEVIALCRRRASEAGVPGGGMWGLERERSGMELVRLEVECGVVKRECQVANCSVMERDRLVVKHGLLEQVQLMIECGGTERECKVAKYPERERVLMVHGVMGSARLEVDRGETEREY